jgi:hypothetical protein
MMSVPEDLGGRNGKKKLTSHFPDLFTMSERAAT